MILSISCIMNFVMFTAVCLIYITTIIQNVPGKTMSHGSYLALSMPLSGLYEASYKQHKSKEYLSFLFLVLSFKFYCCYSFCMEVSKLKINITDSIIVFVFFM